VLCSALALGVAAAARSAARSGVVTATFVVTYTLSASYGNRDTWGSEACKVSGEEHASIGGRIAYGILKLRLASGSTGLGRSRSDFSSEWKESGTQYAVPGAECSAAVKPLQCSGEVNTQGGVDVLAGVRGGTVFFGASVGGFDEAGADHCAASNDSSVPQLGFANALDPYQNVSATVPLARIAALRKGVDIALQATASAPSSDNYSVATCNHTTGELETCHGSLTITVARIRVQRTG
jgi:hypothetical protein